MDFFGPGELERFLLNGHDAESLRRRPIVGTDPSVYAFNVVEWLCDRSGAPSESFFQRLEEVRPRRRKDVLLVRDAFDQRTGHDPCQPTPMPQAQVFLNRVTQWHDVRDRSISRKNEIFFLYGPPDQYLADFTKRVQLQINEETRVPHALRIVSVDRDGDDFPMSKHIWESRLQMALRPGTKVIPGLWDTVRRQAVILFFGQDPMSPDVTDEREFLALLDFIPRLSDIICQAGAGGDDTNPVRLYFALEAQAGHRWYHSLHTALKQLGSGIKGRYIPPDPLAFPSWRDTVYFVESNEWELDPNDWTALEGIYAHHGEGDRDFRRFCSALIDFLRPFPRR